MATLFTLSSHDPYQLPEKYKKRFTKALRNGVRKDGASIEDLCIEWDVTRKTYNAWIVKYPEFAEAHEYGIRDCSAWWQKQARLVAIGVQKGNAGVLNFALKQLETAGWQDTVQVNSHIDKEVHTININVLQPRQLALEETNQEIRVIEHTDD